MGEMAIFIAISVIDLVLRIHSLQCQSLSGKGFLFWDKLHHRYPFFISPQTVLRGRVIIWYQLLISTAWKESVVGVFLSAFSRTWTKYGK